MATFSITTADGSGFFKRGDGTGAPTAPNPVPVGSNVGANGYHAYMRFDTVFPTNLKRTSTIVESRLTLTISGAHDGVTTNAAGCDWEVWASEFGIGVVQSTYNQAASNVVSGNLNGAGTLRQKIDTPIVGGVALTALQEFEVYIPSRYIPPADTDGTTRYGKSNSFADFEIRPSITTLPGATQTINISAGANKPVLAGVVLTEEELDGVTDYRPMATGGESFVALALETTPGTPVKGTVLLDVLSDDLDTAAANIVGEALTRERARPRKKGIGRAGAGGSVSFELTPARWIKMLPGILEHVETITAPSALSVADDGAGLLDAAATYKYKVVMVTPIGDSRPSAETSHTLGGGVSKAALSNIPTGEDGVVTARKIYRTEGGGSTFYLLTTLNDNTTTTYTDNIADSTLTNYSATALTTPTTSYNIHALKVGAARDLKTLTIVQRKGRVFHNVYHGAMISSLGFSIQPDRPIVGSMEVVARGSSVHDKEAVGGDDAPYVLGSTAAYDSTANGMLTYIGVKVLHDDRETGDKVQSVDIVLNQSVNERRGTNRKRGPSSLYALGLTCGVSFPLYFENEIQLRKFFGVSHTEFPLDAEQGRQIQFQEVAVRAAGGVGYDEDTPEQEVLWLFPKLSYDVVRSPIQGEAGIMLNCSATAHVDEDANTNIWMFIKNEDAASIFSASTDYITVLPAGR